MTTATKTDTSLPSAKEIAELLHSLFGFDVAVRDAAKEKAVPFPVVANYVNDEGLVRRILACDLVLANGAGAGLSMIPPGAAQDATKSGQVPENLFINLHEVLNICVTLFAEHSRERIVLGDVLRPGDVQDAASIAAMTKRDAGTQFCIDLGRYGVGRMLLAVAGE